MPDTPPRYRKTEARFDQVCELCREYVKGFCDRYRVPVDFYFTCDSWRRNTDIPPEVV